MHVLDEILDQDGAIKIARFEKKDYIITLVNRKNGNQCGLRINKEVTLYLQDDIQQMAVGTAILDAFEKTKGKVITVDNQRVCEKPGCNKTLGPKEGKFCMAHASYLGQ